MVPPGGKPERHYEHLVAQGEYDEQIEQLCQALSELGAPAFVRIGYEFNGSWNGYEPAAYKAAWKHLVKAFRAHRLDNVAAVWCYVPRGGKLTYSFMDWYPGDEWVDWWGLDLFWPDSFTYHDALSFMDQAAKHKFPVMIGESTPRSVGVLDGQESWEKWFVPYFDFIRRYDTVKAFCYISWDWGGTGRWSTWGDARIEVNDSVLERYKKELSHENYLHGTSETDIRRDLGCDPAGK